MEPRAATLFTGGHSDDVDFVAWNPTHPELFCTSSQKDRRIVFWDARRPSVFDSLKESTILTIFARKQTHPTGPSQSITCTS